MDPVTPAWEQPGARSVVFGAGQPEYLPLPALVFADGKVLVEFAFTEEERAAVARGENLRLWIWKGDRPLQPLAVELTNEQVA